MINMILMVLVYWGFENGLDENGNNINGIKGTEKNIKKKSFER